MNVPVMGHEMGHWGIKMSQMPHVKKLLTKVYPARDKGCNNLLTMGHWDAKLKIYSWRNTALAQCPCNKGLQEGSVTPPPATGKMLHVWH
ncbi:hypothetical protein C7B16_10650 [Escherichia sp. 20412-1]|nr:hypothetical protein C7B16_10650 [Escherichia sp. 20412-1]